MFTAGALTYTDLQCIDRDALLPIVDAFPQYRRSRLEKLVRIRILREKLRLFVAAVRRMERHYEWRDVTAGGLAFTEIALAAIPPVVLWEMRGHGAEGAGDAAAAAAAGGRASSSGGGAAWAAGGRPSGAPGAAAAQSRAARDESLIQQLKEATTSGFDQDEDEEGGGAGSGELIGGAGSPLFTMESVLLCMSKAVPDYFELASSSAVTIQRVFRGFIHRLGLARMIGEARTRQLPLREVLRRDERDKQMGEEAQQLAVMVAREVISLLRVQGLVPPRQQQPEAGGGGGGGGWPFPPEVPALVERAVLANGHLRRGALSRRRGAGGEVASASASAGDVRLADAGSEDAPAADAPPARPFGAALIRQLSGSGLATAPGGPAGSPQPPRPRRSVHLLVVSDGGGPELSGVRAPPRPPVRTRSGPLHPVGGLGAGGGGGVGGGPSLPLVAHGGLGLHVPAAGGALQAPQHLLGVRSGLGAGAGAHHSSQTTAAQQQQPAGRRGGAAALPGAPAASGGGGGAKHHHRGEGEGDGNSGAGGGGERDSQW